ncbi:MAG TPA: shikimate kinase [Gemmataceae bacterium]|nr:shikimate kinase [Gemmataceae bacterium]
MSDQPLPIFLIGLRGTGKSSVARLLAERLGWNWRDADADLEQQQGRSIREIFAHDGETAFRDIEAAIFADLCNLPRHVVATGGGIILRADNRQRLKDSGKVVWLTADAGTLWQRLQVDPDTKHRRPDLTVGGLAEIEGLLQVREPLYAECAHFVVDTVGRCPEDVAKAILDKLAAKP